MADEIKVGMALLDYVEEVALISADLCSALSEVETAKTALEDAYTGDAKEYMQAYLNQLYHHLEKMILFYANLAAYINGAFEKITKKDEALSRWVLKNCEYVEVS